MDRIPIIVPAASEQADFSPARAPPAKDHVPGQTYPPLVHRPARVFEARGSVHKAWISLALKTSNAVVRKRKF